VRVIIHAYRFSHKRASVAEPFLVVVFAWWVAVTGCGVGGKRERQRVEGARKGGRSQRHKMCLAKLRNMSALGSTTASN